MPESPRLTRRDFLKAAAVAAVSAPFIDLRPSIASRGPEASPEYSQETRFYQNPLRRYGKLIPREILGDTDGLGYRVEEPFLPQYLQMGELNSRWGFPRSNQFQIDEIRSGQLFETALVQATEQEAGGYIVEELPVRAMLHDQGYGNWLDQNFPVDKNQSIWKIVTSSHLLVPPAALVPETADGPYYSERPYPIEINGQRVTITNLGALHGVTSKALEDLDNYIASQGVDHINLIVTDYQHELPAPDPEVVLIGFFPYAFQAIPDPSREGLSFDVYFNVEAPPNLFPERPPPGPSPELERHMLAILTREVSATAWFKRPSKDWPKFSGTDENRAAYQREIDSADGQRSVFFLTENAKNGFPVLRIAPSI